MGLADDGGERGRGKRTRKEGMPYGGGEA